MSLFAERGFDAVTITEICEAADVGRGTFFLHFPNKAALLYEFSVRVADQFTRQLRKPRDSAESELKALIELMAAEILASGEIMAAMIREFFNTPPRPQDLDDASCFPELVTAIIERGQVRGEFSSSMSPRLASASLLATALAILSGHVFEPDEASLEEVLRQFYAQVFSGLAKS
jgi:AcrR family transcriptional regulator